jgi:hypothetical protein
MPKTGARYRKERRGRVKKDKEEKRRLGRERAAESYARATVLLTSLVPDSPT